jgi:hypothetical protein
MAGPWEKYASPAAESPGPWAKYAAPAQATSAVSAQPAAPVGSEGVQHGRRIMDAVRQVNKEEGNLFLGTGEAALGLASGIGSSAVGGLKGLWDGGAVLARGGSGDDALEAATKTIHGIQEAGTYQPRTGVGKLVSEVAMLPLGIAKSAMSSMGGDIGQAVNGDQGRIAGESIGGVIPEVAGTLMMGRQGMRAAPAISTGIGKVVQPMAERVRASAQLQAADDAGALAGTSKLGELVARQRAANAPAVATGPQSAGAAAAQHANMAAAAGASPEIIKIITDAGNDVHPLAAARHAEASSLPVPVSLSEGMATGNAELFSLEQNSRGRIPRFGAFLDDINGQLVENFDAIRQRVAPDVAARGVDLGQMAVDAYKNMDAPVRANISSLYKALEDANGGEFPLSGADFVASADAALKKANRARFVPSEVQGIMSELREGGPMTFADFETYRTILAEQSRKAERAGDGTASYAVGLVRNALESLPMTGETAALKPLADAARNAAKARFNTIAADPAYKAAINDGVEVGASSPLADSFMQKYVIKGTTAHAENMRANLANDPLNAQIIAAGVVDQLKHVAGIDLRTNIGNVSQAGLNGAIGSIGKKGSIILGPETMDTVNTLGNVARYTMKQSKGTFVSNSGTAPALEAVMGAANTALDVKTYGATKILRKMMDNRTAAKGAERSMAPGAGINIATSPVLAKAAKADLIRQAQANQAATAAADVQAQSNLAARMALGRQQKAAAIAGAKSVDEAINAFSAPTD